MTRAEMDHGQLPPLCQAVPEIRHNYPLSTRQPPYSRSVNSSQGSNHFPEAHSLAPSPIFGSSRSRPQQHATFSQYPHPTPNSHPESPQYGSRGSTTSSSTSYSDQYRPRASYPSASEPLPAIRSRSPILLPAPRVSNGNGTSSSERLPFDAASLPSVHDISSGTYPPPSRPGLSFSQSYNDAYYPSRRNASPPRPIPYPSYGGGAYRPEYAYTTGQYYERSPFSNGGVGSYALGFDGVSDHGDGKQKRRRGNLPKAVTDTLRVWFTEHIAHPYPTEEEKQILMGQTGLTISQISNWFINARRRSLPQMTKQAQTEAEIRDGQSALAAAKVRV